MSQCARLARGISSTIKLNDGVDMPMFGLGVGPGGKKATKETIDATEDATKYAIACGYRLLDSAVIYGLVLPSKL